MSESVKVSRTDPIVRRIIEATFPDYPGRKVFIVPRTIPLDVRSYWCGGSRSYFTFYDLRDGRTMAMPPQSAFDKEVPGADSVTVPENFVCVEHVYFCGKDLGLRIYVNPKNLAALLFPPAANAAVA